VAVLYGLFSLSLEGPPPFELLNPEARNRRLPDYLPTEVRRNSAPKSTPIPNENVFSRNGTLRL
jgi:hypothetical protein